MHEKRGMKRFMVGSGLWRRLAPLILAMMLLLAGHARAEGLEGLEAAYAGEGLAGEASLTLNAWPDLSPETLSAMQAWLSFLRLRFEADAQKSGLALYDGGRMVFRADSSQAGEEKRLILQAPGALAPTAYVGTADDPPAQALFGIAGVPDVKGLIDALPRLAQALTKGLEPYAAPQDAGSSLRAAGRAESRVNYALSAQEANAWWQEALPELRAIWQEAARGLPADWRLAASEGMDSLRFTGKLTLRRLLDAQGQDLGFQAMAGLEALGKAWKLDFTAGYREETGFYLALKLPAARGKDRVDALVSLAFSGKAGETLTKGDYSFSRVLEGDKELLSGKVNLALAGESRLRGEVTAQARRTGGSPLKRDHSFVPDFAFSGGQASGSLRWTEREGKNTLRDLTLTLSIAPGASSGAAEPQAMVDLRQADGAARGYASRQAAQAMLPYLREKLLTLPQELRLLVLHDWGRVRRALGEAQAEPLPENDPNPFTVVDDYDIQPESKEETP